MMYFPVLKTSAVAQYPAGQTISFRNQVLRFVDGREQRYPDSAGPLHGWRIQLSQLDEREMAAINEFFSANQGRAGTFVFTDPWDGMEYENCSLGSDEWNWVSVGEMSGATVLTVIENR